MEEHKVSKARKTEKNSYTILVSLCCVCGEVLGWKLGYGLWGVSHSYCAACLAAFYVKEGLSNED